jgi:putative transposase
VRDFAPFHIDAWVVLPEHLHCVWTLPEWDADYSGRWRMIKAGFSARMPAARYRSESKIAKGEKGIWQRRFWEQTIRDERDYAVHVDYVHFNSVRHGLVARAADWPHSTFHRAVREGLYPADWGGGSSWAGIDDDVGWVKRSETHRFGMQTWQGC